MTKNNLYTFFAIAALILATNAVALSYFAASKITIDTSEINNIEAIERFVEVMTGIGYAQGKSIDSDGVRRAIIEDKHSLRAYFLAFVSDNPSRERFEITATLDKDKHMIEIYFRELMTKNFSDLGMGRYQSLVGKLREEFGSDKVITW